MTDTTTTTLLDRIGEQAVAIHLRDRTIAELRVELEAANARGDRLAAVAKDGQERLNAALARAAKATQRRIDVVDGETTLVEWGRIAVTDGHARAEVLLRWLREPVGGAS